MPQRALLSQPSLNCELPPNRNAMRPVLEFHAAIIAKWTNGNCKNYWSKYKAGA